MTESELRAIPKVELHRHLECSIRLATLRELIRNAGLECPDDEREFRTKYLVTEPMNDLESVLRKFLATQKVLSTEEILARITFEQIEDAYNEGTRILELRYAPTFVELGHPHLTFERIHAGILEGVRRARHLPVAVGLIAIIQRILPVRDAARVTDFVIDHKDSFVALDLADNEVGFDPAPFAPHFARAKKAGLRITVHSGEAKFPGSAECVRTAINMLGAERIGHGVQIAESPSVLEFVRAQGVPLELCPTSNWLTNAVPSLQAHPFRKLMHAGVKVSINSDDPGVFGIDLTNEYSVLAANGLTLQDFERCNDMAAACSFIPLAERQKVWPRPIDERLGI